MPVRTLCNDDREAWLRMRGTLWPDELEDTAAAEHWLARVDAVTLVAELSPGVLVGFAEAGERSYADGCDSSPVAFLEGWYVDGEHRGKGWARGFCREF